MEFVDFLVQGPYVTEEGNKTHKGELIDLVSLPLLVVNLGLESASLEPC